MKKGLPEGTGPPEWTQRPRISVSLQERGGCTAFLAINCATGTRGSDFHSDQILLFEKAVRNFLF